MLSRINSAMPLSNYSSTSKTQKSPAFKGTINVIAEDLSKAPLFDNMVNCIARNLQDQCIAGYGENLSEGNKGFVSFPFSNSIDVYAKMFTDNWNKLLTDMKSNISIKLEK